MRWCSGRSGTVVNLPCGNGTQPARGSIPIYKFRKGPKSGGIWSTGEDALFSSPTEEHWSVQSGKGQSPAPGRTSDRSQTPDRAKTPIRRRTLERESTPDGVKPPWLKLYQHHLRTARWWSRSHLHLQGRPPQGLLDGLDLGRTKSKTACRKRSLPDSERSEREHIFRNTTFLHAEAKRAGDSEEEIAPSPNMRRVLNQL